MWGGHPGMSNSCHAGLMVRQLGALGLSFGLAAGAVANWGG